MLALVIIHGVLAAGGTATFAVEVFSEGVGGLGTGEGGVTQGGVVTVEGCRGVGLGGTRTHVDVEEVLEVDLLLLFPSRLLLTALPLPTTALNLDRMD